MVYYGKCIKKIKNEYMIETFFVIILGIILFYTLFMNPIVGKCDNGDFSRIYLQSGLMDQAKNTSELYDGTVHRVYKINRLITILPWAQDWSSGVLIAKAGAILCSVFDLTESGEFNLSIQTFIYCSMYLVAVFMILNYKKMTKAAKIAAGIFIAVFFTDISYISYFNSFFGEAAVIVFMFLFIGTTLNIISKEKHGAMYFYYKDKRRLIIIAVSIITFLSVLMFISIDSDTNMNNMYQAVFRGILTDSKNPQQDLEELGIDKNFAYLREHPFFEKNNPIDVTGEYLKENFYSKMSSVKVLKFYLTHPARMWEKMNVSAEHAYDFYNIGINNFEKGKYPNDKTVNLLRYKLIQKYKYLRYVKKK